MSETTQGADAAVYERAIRDAAAYLRLSVIGMRYGEPGTTVPAEQVPEILMEVLRLAAESLLANVGKIAALNSLPLPGTLAAVMDGCRCGPSPDCPIHAEGATEGCNGR